MDRKTLLSQPQTGASGFPTTNLHIPPPPSKKLQCAIDITFSSGDIMRGLLQKIASTETILEVPKLSYVDDIKEAIRGEIEKDGSREIQNQWAYLGDAVLNWWLYRELLLELRRQLKPTLKNPEDVLTEASNYQTELRKVHKIMRSNSFFAFLAYMLGMVQTWDTEDKISADVLEAFFGALSQDPAPSLNPAVGQEPASSQGPALSQGLAQPNLFDSFVNDVFRPYIVFAIQKYVRPKPTQDIDDNPFEEDDDMAPLDTVQVGNSSKRGRANSSISWVSRDEGRTLRSRWKQITVPLVKFCEETQVFTVRLQDDDKTGSSEFTSDKLGRVLVKNLTISGQTMKISWEKVPATKQRKNPLRVDTYSSEYALDDHIDLMCPRFGGGEPDLLRAEIVGPLVSIDTYKFLEEHPKISS